MYNRYIPQSDGSYRKSQMQDKPPKQQQSCPQTRPQPKPEPPCPPPGKNSDPPPGPPPGPNPPPRKEPPKTAPPPCIQGDSALSFLRQLLPKNLDTGDLLVIILLLLMAGDCKEDQNFALLTLAIYLFL